MAKTKDTDTLGYYFIIFQSNLRGYVKCWLDGDEDYSFLSREDFLDLFEKINSDFSLVCKAKDCLDTTGIYIWDINSKTIKRLTNKSERPSLIEDLNRINPFLNEKNNKDVIERRIF